MQCYAHTKAAEYIFMTTTCRTHTLIHGKLNMHFASGWYVRFYKPSNHYKAGLLVYSSRFASMLVVRFYSTAMQVSRSKCLKNIFRFVVCRWIFRFGNESLVSRSFLIEQLSLKYKIYNISTLNITALWSSFRRCTLHRGYVQKIHAHTLRIGIWTSVCCFE